MGSVMNTIQRLMNYSPHTYTPTHHSFNHIASTGSITAESLAATITTIPKPGKTPDDPASYKPISLLDTATKLYAKLIASLLSKIIPHLVHPDQVGFVTGRQTSDGTRRFIDLLQWVKHHQMPLCSFDLTQKRHFNG